MDNNKCHRCGGELIQKNKMQLLLSGLVFVAFAGMLLFLSFKFWPLSFFLIMISLYLITWSTRGKGRWCRQCKAAPFK